MKFFSLLHAPLLLQFFFPLLIVGNLIYSQYQALYIFYNSTNGPHWDPSCNHLWQFNTPIYNDPCVRGWEGLTCDPSDCSPDVICYVRMIELENCNLTGTLPIEIGDLVNLNTLTVPQNHLNGSIPSALTKNHRLHRIDLSDNSFTGSLPDLAPSVILALFRHNSLTGTLPQSLSNSLLLNYLDVGQNYLTGSIPSNLVTLPNLIGLVFDNNRITGTVLGSISPTIQNYIGSKNLLHGSIPLICSDDSCDLFIFRLNENDLSGSLPAELFLSESISELNLSYNRITGSIPSSVTSLTHLNIVDLTSNLLTGCDLAFSSNSLRILNLGSNLFSGAIPTLPNFVGSPLSYLNLSDNYFSGSPTFDERFAMLETFSLSSNLFTSSLPSTIASISFLQQFHLSENFFTSSIPLELATLPVLLLLDLSENYLSGTIPPHLFNSSFPYPTYSILFNLYLHKNFLTGSISTNLCRGFLLRQLTLFNNLLTGTLPPLQNCANLQTILLQGNHLTGDPGLAFEVTSPSMTGIRFHLLQAIDLSDNDFSGTIPKQIFLLPSILFVAIVGGCFRGHFPLEICNATSLNALVLEGLRSGRNCRDDFWDPFGVISNRVYRTSTVGKSIPQCIWNLTNLETLYLSGNLIEGSIPDALSLPSSLVRLSLSYNKLTGTIPKILQKQNFEYFDLEHNRLTGTSEDIVVSPDSYNQTQITLSVNRLSGHIRNLKSLEHIDVLSGNTYSCAYGRSDLPHNDPDSSTYWCGSDALDLALFFWMLLTIIFVIGVGIFLFVTLRSRSFFNNSISDRLAENPSTNDHTSHVDQQTDEESRRDSNTSSLDVIPEIWDYFEEILKIDQYSSPELIRFVKTLSFLRKIAFQLGLMTSTIFLGFYLFMKLELDSSTHE
jgi:Leucine-rich repeat (LRR) protein